MALKFVLIENHHGAVILRIYSYKLWFNKYIFRWSVFIFYEFNSYIVDSLGGNVMFDYGGTIKFVYSF